MSKQFTLTNNIQTLQAIKKECEFQSKTRYELISLFAFLRAIQNPNHQIFKQQESVFITKLKLASTKLEVNKREKPDFETIDQKYGIEIIQPRIKVGKIKNLDIEKLFWNEIDRLIIKHLNSYLVNYPHNYEELHFIIDMRDFGKYRIYHQQQLIKDFLIDPIVTENICKIHTKIMNYPGPIFAWLLLENNTLSLTKEQNCQINCNFTRYVQFIKQNRINPIRGIK